MTIIVRAIFECESNDDALFYARLMDRIPILERVLRKSMHPYRIESEHLFDDVGGLAGEMVEFYIDEFFEGIVLDTVKTVEMGNMDWRDWFRTVYKSACA